MNVGDIVTRVRNAAGDSQALQFSNTMINDWINDGIREVVVENSLLQKTASSSTAVGTNEYALPTDIFKLHSVLIDSSQIQIITMQEWNQRFDGSTSQDSGPPEVGYVWATKLTVWPTPSAVVPLKINYTYDPGNITYSNTPDETLWKATVLPIPASYHARVVTYCLAQVAMQDDDMNKYTALMDEFRTGVKSLMHQNESEEDLYPHISVSNRDSGNYYEFYGDY